MPALCAGRSHAVLTRWSITAWYTLLEGEIPPAPDLSLDALANPHTAGQVWFDDNNNILNVGISRRLPNNGWQPAHTPTVNNQSCDTLALVTEADGTDKALVHCANDSGGPRLGALASKPNPQWLIGSGSGGAPLDYDLGALGQTSDGTLHAATITNGQLSYAQYNQGWTIANTAVPAGGMADICQPDRRAARRVQQ